MFLDFVFQIDYKFFLPTWVVLLCDYSTLLHAVRYHRFLSYLNQITTFKTFVQLQCLSQEADLYVLNNYKPSYFRVLSNLGIHNIYLGQSKIAHVYSTQFDLNHP
jgi:hypothetical protein